MPVMDGIQAMEKICTMSFAVPIIAVMAYAFYTEQQAIHIETLFRGKTERNDRILYWLINFLKGNQHSGNCSVIKIIITL